MNASGPRRRNVEKYEDLSEDLAGTYHRATKTAAENVEPGLLEGYLAQLEADGFVVLEDAISSTNVAQAKAAIEPLLELLGRNNFEGLKTQRAYSLLQKTRALDSIVAHSVVLAILERMLGEALLSACLAINICPGEDAQLPHFDDGFYPQQRPRKALGISVIWALDPFTEANGATTVWPGSHRWDDERRPTPEDPHFPATMAAGSAIVFSGTLWHGGGANHSSKSRLALTTQYCAPWLRTQENMSLAVSPATVAGLSEELQTLLGYAIHPPFMGHVNGMHPKRLLEERE